MFLRIPDDRERLFQFNVIETLDTFDFTAAEGVTATQMHALATQKRRVLFTRAADLVRRLLEERDAPELTRLQQRLRRVDVLIVDELGFVLFDRAGGELSSI